MSYDARNADLIFQMAATPYRLRPTTLRRRQAVLVVYLAGPTLVVARIEHRPRW